MSTVYSKLEAEISRVEFLQNELATTPLHSDPIRAAKRKQIVLHTAFVRLLKTILSGCRKHRVVYAQYVGKRINPDTMCAIHPDLSLILRSNEGQMILNWAIIMATAGLDISEERITYADLTDLILCYSMAEHHKDEILMSIQESERMASLVTVPFSYN